MVVPCVAELSDPVNDAMVPRRCSARIKKLKSEQEAQRERESQRVRCRSNDDSVLGKKTKVYKKSKLVTPSQAQTQAPNNDVTVATVDNDDVTITNVAAPNDCTDHPVPENSLNPQLSGNGTEKSSHARVTETLRIFNKHYLHFVQVSSISHFIFPDNFRKQTFHKTRQGSVLKHIFVTCVYDSNDFLSC